MASTKPSKKSPPRRRAPMPPYVVKSVDDDQSPAPRPAKFIFKPEVLKLTGYTFPTIWRWMRDGQFPMSFDIGTKTAWSEDEINDWLANRPRSNLKKREG
jgi:predicted DNA-binding transcriptional regulator AlpA